VHFGTGRIQVVTYTAKGDSFEAAPPRVWVDNAEGRLWIAAALVPDLKSGC
jgi:hypothetical protein